MRSPCSFQAARDGTTLPVTSSPRRPMAGSAAGVQAHCGAAVSREHDAVMNVGGPTVFKHQLRSGNVGPSRAASDYQSGGTINRRDFGYEEVDRGLRRVPEQAQPA